VKRNKNGAADAEAICEAVMRPTMRFVPVKEREQQAVPALPSSASLARKVAQRCGASLNRRWTRLPPS
jgi:transposase